MSTVDIISQSVLMVLCPGSTPYKFRILSHNYNLITLTMVLLVHFVLLLLGCDLPCDPCGRAWFQTANLWRNLLDVSRVNETDTAVVDSCIPSLASTSTSCPNQIRIMEGINDVANY